MRNRGTWTNAKLAYLDEVKDVLDNLRGYWPLTLRQVYYQLVAALVIENNRGQYQKLSRILSQARLDGLVPWHAIEDRARSTLTSGGWQTAGSFVRSEVESFLDGYRRDLTQGQSHALELWVEKDALSRVCHDIAFEYCVPVVVAKGFSSVSYVHQAAERIRRNKQQGKQTKILYFGDLDPSGWEMLPSMMHTLQVEMDLEDDVEGIRCALTPAQVKSYSLPRSPDAIKATDSRAKKYVARFGAIAVELDALKPQLLQQIIRTAIEGNLDMDAFREQEQEQEHERGLLDALRERTTVYVQQEWSELEGEDGEEDW